MKSKDDKRDNTLESCGCIKAKVLDTGHYCSQPHRHQYQQSQTEYKAWRASITSYEGDPRYAGMDV